MDKLQALKTKLQEEFPLGEAELENNMFALARDLHYANPKKIELAYVRMMEIHLDGGNWIYAINEVL